MAPSTAHGPHVAALTRREVPSVMPFVLPPSRCARTASLAVLLACGAALSTLAGATGAAAAAPVGDSVPPTVGVPVLSSAVVAFPTPGDGYGRAVQVRVPVTDDASGVAAASLRLRAPDGSYRLYCSAPAAGCLSVVRGSLTASDWWVTVALDSLDAGTWTVADYDVVDAAGNEAVGPFSPAPSFVVGRLPGPVKAVRVVPGDASLAVSWSPPTDAGSGVTGYRVEVTGPDGAPVASPTLGAATTATVVGGLTDGTSYRVRVVVLGVVGETRDRTPAARETTPRAALPATAVLGVTGLGPGARGALGVPAQRIELALRPPAAASGVIVTLLDAAGVDRQHYDLPSAPGPDGVQHVLVESPGNGPVTLHVRARSSFPAYSPESDVVVLGVAAASLPDRPTARRTVLAGAPLHVTGTLVDATSQAPLAGQPATLGLEPLTGARPHVLARTTSDSSGHLAATVRVRASGYLVWHCAGGTSRVGAVGTAARLLVTPAVAVAAPRTAAAGRPFRVTATVTGRATRTAAVLQERVAGRWRTRPASSSRTAGSRPRSSRGRPAPTSCASSCPRCAGCTGLAPAGP
ncbi:fibronectin type III domain protein [Motilibacter peucedani]|uniref:Fibronectin type III domain protein n=1 Tax=Motilibacter peucedani TaxID=598650 RepID=A0A420XV70_9ACTN|nr:fibronectin type III domain-containing protein [Motilibacter peucedani]RKS84185.1 fibronectin type III domain protein [Motilibacter peucedani]